jgi:hypothetical protein
MGHRHLQGGFLLVAILTKKLTLLQLFQVEMSSNRPKLAKVERFSCPINVIGF